MRRIMNSSVIRATEDVPSTNFTRKAALAANVNPLRRTRGHVDHWTVPLAAGSQRPLPSSIQRNWVAREEANQRLGHEGRVHDLQKVPRHRDDRACYLQQPRAEQVVGLLEPG